ncbi:hypothetical protein M0R04_10185 [Candidatus Dojkabacteria bacterium]|jgi:hypothetical protein|nr:hypothetical protein [Candidatus Dojkabacteria bacterium]
MQIFKDIKEILSLVRKPKVIEIKPEISDLTRHQLSSIDLKDFEKLLPQNEAERKAYIQYVASGFKSYLDPLFKKLIQAQLEFIGHDATDWDKVNFSRGTLNGLTLIKDEFEKCFAEHIQDFMDANTKPIDKSQTIGDLN